MGIDWIEPLAEVQQVRQRSNNTKVFVCICVCVWGGVAGVENKMQKQACLSEVIKNSSALGRQ